MGLGDGLGEGLGLRVGWRCEGSGGPAALDTEQATRSSEIIAMPKQAAWPPSPGLHIIYYISFLRYVLSLVLTRMRAVTLNSVFAMAYLRWARECCRCCRKAGNDT
jgi:hypothetical protein